MHTYIHTYMYARFLVPAMLASCGTIGVSWYQHCRQVWVQSASDTYIHTYIHTCTIPSTNSVDKLLYNRGFLVPALSTSMGTIGEQYMHRSINTYIHTYIHTCMHAYMHAHIHPHRHTYMHDSWYQLC